MAKKTDAKQESATYQSMLTNVETIVSDLADPDLDLDKLVGKVEEGYTLIKQMRTRLEETQQKIDTLRASHEG